MLKFKEKSIVLLKIMSFTDKINVILSIIVLDTDVKCCKVAMQVEILSILINFDVNFDNFVELIYLK